MNSLRCRDGISAALPICIGYFPLGFAFGVLAQKAGLDLIDIALMSVLVFAGSSQFIAVAMLSGAAAPLPIILTTFFVNLRHVLMSSALAVYLHGSGYRFLSAFAYGVTDESFAVNVVRFREGSWSRYLALVVNQTANLAWIVSTILGGYGGQFIPANFLGIDYALPAMFLCLLAYQLRGRIYALTAPFLRGPCCRSLFDDARKRHCDTGFNSRCHCRIRPQAICETKKSWRMRLLKCLMRTIFC